MFLLLSKVVLFLNCCRGMRDFALRALKHLQLPLKSSLEAAPLSARGSIIGHGWEKNSVCSLPGLQMHHPEQGTPLWPDCLFPCLILPNKREDRKEIRAPERSKICPLCPAEPALTSHGRKPRAMVTALLGLGHSQQTHLGFKKYIPLPFSVFCSLCFSSSLQFQKLTRGFGLEFGVYLSPYQQLCCDPVSQLSLSSRYSLLCSLLRKTFPCLVQPHLLPQLRVTLGHQGEGNHSCKPGRVWSPGRGWELSPSSVGDQALQAKLGDFILQRRDCSLEPAVQSLISFWEAHTGCFWDLQPTEGSQNIKPDQFLPWLENKLDAGFYFKDQNMLMPSQPGWKLKYLVVMNVQMCLLIKLWEQVIAAFCTT